MIGHPDRATLEAFLLGRLVAGRRKDVFLHLLGGCSICQESMDPLTGVMFHPGAQEPELTVELDAAYDAAISAACVKAMAWQENAATRENLDAKVERLLSGTAPAEPGFWTAALCETLVERSRALRHDDPAGMLRMAQLAREAADQVDPSVHGLRETADLRVRAWAELGNAWRVCDDLRQAEAALEGALELRAEGTGSRLLLARLADLSASLLCDQRRISEGFQMLDTAHSLYRQEGAAHDAARILLMKGLYLGNTGNPEEGLQVLSQVLGELDHEKDPQTVFQVLHNVLLFRVELGELEEAQRQLQRMRPLYDRHASPFVWTKLRGIEGKIASGLGDLARAEQLFREVRREFDAAGLGYQAALISLDLAAVCLRVGKKAEVRQLVSEMVAAFRSLGVEREAMAALLMLNEAVEQDQATLELLALVSGVLQKLERGPGLLVRPDPD
jgi:tetratricopeptide (TPR) repeat protein